MVMVFLFALRGATLISILEQVFKLLVAGYIDVFVGVMQLRVAWGAVATFLMILRSHHPSGGGAVGRWTRAGP